MSKVNYLKLAVEAGDQYLATLAEGQETFLKSLTTLSTQAPAAAVPAFTVAMPSVQEVTEANFSFAQKLLKQQKEFVEKFLAATTPVSH